MSSNSNRLSLLNQLPTSPIYPIDTIMGIKQVQKRNTRQKEAAKKAFNEHNHPLSPAELHREIKNVVPGVGIATVYRIINNLVAEGEIIAVSLPGEAPRYEKSGKKHHHHFKCTTCDVVFDIEGCAPGVSDLLPRGFELHAHEITLFGRCSSCGDSLITIKSRPNIRTKRAS
jgi:Fur family ferric uptake transcriptional regulator